MLLAIIHLHGQHKSGSRFGCDSSFPRLATSEKDSLLACAVSPVRSRLRHRLYSQSPDRPTMKSTKKKTYVVEHLDPELGAWSFLEYKAIAFESQASGSSFILSRLPPSFEVPDDLSKIPSFTAEKRGAEELYVGDDKRQACLLDPAAAKDLCPEDAEVFNIFLFGGILGMYVFVLPLFSFFLFLRCLSFLLGPSQF